MSGDQILIERGLRTGTIKIPEKLEFADGFRWSYDESVQYSGSYYEGTEAADTLVGNAYANHYLGLGW